MFLVFAFIFAASATLSQVDKVSTGAYGLSPTTTNAEVFRQELFSRAAKRYVAKNPSTVSQLSWTQLKSVMPSSFNAGSYNADFKVKFFAAQKYVICGRLKNDAAANVSMSRQSEFYTKPLGDGFFASSPDETTLNTYYAQCKSPTGAG